MDKVQIYIRADENPSKETPIVVSRPKDIRIAYGGYWIEFNNGALTIIKDEVKVHHPPRR